MPDSNPVSLTELLAAAQRGDPEAQEAAADLAQRPLVEPFPAERRRSATRTPMSMLWVSYWTNQFSERPAEPSMPKEQSMPKFPAQQAQSWKAPTLRKAQRLGFPWT